MPRKLKGIRRKRAGWQSYVRVNGHVYSKMWPLATPRQEMRDWLDEEREAHGPTVVDRYTDRRIYQPVRVWWIYFIQRDGHVKIGRTTNVEKRLRALQTANSSPLRLLATVLESTVGERTIHQRFLHLRLSGEWFQLEPDLLAFIQSCAN